MTIIIIVLLIVIYLVWVNQSNKAAGERARAERLEKERIEREKHIEQIAEEQLKKQMELEETLKATMTKMDGMYERSASRAEEGYLDGFIYVLKNKSFRNENLYKIGMTRRLDPNVRVKELNNASVPFNFEVVNFYRAEDALAVEKDIHKEIKDYKYNKEKGMHGKEFFELDYEQVNGLFVKRGLTPFKNNNG